MAVVVRRLLKRADFLKLKAEGLCVNTQAFVLQWMDNPTEPGLGVGFTASGALGNAVKRNRGRRRVQAAFDEICRLNKACEAFGKHIVLVVKMPVFTIDFAYLLKDMRKALESAGVRFEDTRA